MSDSLKNLFKKGGNRATLDNKSISEIADETNSVTDKYVAEYVNKKRRFVPHIDFASASNFIKFGLAERYYEDAVDRITNLYPYDGSAYEKLQWENSSSFLEIHLYDGEYPRSTGYVTFASGGYAIDSEQRGNPTTKEYIHFYGGPNTASAGMIGKPISTTYSGSNVWDTGSLRESNLKFDLSGSGATVEFWIKFGDLDPNTTTDRQVIFDLSNDQISGSDGFAGPGRFQLYYYNDEVAGNSGFNALLQSGSVSQQTKLYTISDGLTLANTGSWNHYAIVLQNTGSDGTDLGYRVYENGTLANTVQETGQAINEITGALRSTIGAAAASYYVTPGSTTGSIGWYKLSGSVDELRYWKTARNAKEIGLNWLDQVYGGVNKEDATNKLGVYYKFNEGITTDAATDKIILDYSGRITNGTFIGYAAGSRNTGSAIIEASASFIEFEDPIVRKNNPDVVTLKTNLMNSGSVYDYENISSIYRSLPTWIQEEDGDNGALKKLVQVMSTYFDSAYLQIKELSSIKDNKTYTSPKDKPYPFMRELLESLGLTAPEMFVEATIIEDLLARGDNKLFADDLFNVKSRIYENVYNNLIHIYKSKGTERAFRNLIRCFGVDEEVIDLKIYADGVEYEISENLRNKTSRKKYLNFHTADNSNAICYQQTASGNPNSTPYLSGSDYLQDGFGMTFEADVIFPQGYDSVTRNGVLIGPTIMTASVYGVHTPVANGDTPQWAASDTANFQVLAIKQNTQSDPSMGEVSFMLTSSQVDAAAEGPLPELTSSAFPGIYSAKRWNFAVKIAPTSYPQSCMVSGSCDDDYKVEFYGVNIELGEKQHEFYLTGAMTSEEGKAFMRSHKRFYVGANRRNFTGSMLQKSDVKISSARAWLDVLGNDEILAHAKDPTSFGRLHPYRQAFMVQGTGSDDSVQNYIPRINTRLLDWDFELVTSSSAGILGPTYNDAGFDVIDLSSGSLANAGRAGWLGNILYLQHTGRGDMFMPNLTDVVDTNYVFMQKQQTMENVDSSDLIKVASNDDIYFDRTTRPMNYQFSIEKSMNDAVSRQMLSYFATITDFNNLIGESVNRYRQSYKNLEKLREIFFSHVENDTIEFEKYLEYYKWLDQSVTTMLLQLIPASANFAETTRTVIESHVLERNKYWNKFPTLESKFSDPEDPARGINELLYDWKHGHHPISNLQSQNCFWWHQKAERSAGLLSSSDAGVNTDRTEILSASQQTFNRKLDSVYEFKAVEVKDIRAGSNAPTNAKEKSVLSTFGNIENEESMALYHDYVYISGSDLEQFDGCDDVLKPTFIDAEGNPATKKRVSYYTHTGSASDGSPTDIVKENAPLTFYSSSVSSGSAKVIHDVAGFEGIEATNLHNDSHGPDYEIPLQGPFTEKYVGGYQYRHVELNSDLKAEFPAAGLDNKFNRPEGYRVLKPGEVGGSPSSLVIAGPMMARTGSDALIEPTYAARFNSDSVHQTGSWDAILGPDDTDFTISVWYNSYYTAYSEAGSGWAALIGLDDDTGMDEPGHGISLLYGDALKIDPAINSELSLDKDGETGEGSSGKFVNDEYWHHLVMTYTYGSPNTAQLYVDGQLIYAIDAADIVDKSDYYFILGGEYDGTRQVVNSSLAECTIWKKTLSASEIAELYGSSHGYTGIMSPKEHSAYLNDNDILAAWYRMGDGSRDSFSGDYFRRISDDSGNQLDIDGVDHVNFWPEKILNIYAGSDSYPSLNSLDVQAPYWNPEWTPNAARWRGAKRPVNISNIQQKTGSYNVGAVTYDGGLTKIGNFEKNYQIVQTSGRKANNLFIESLSISNSESSYVTGVIDYSLPERTTNKTVITERFSAPGSGEVMARGTRDYTSEEYSPYNAMPWRNLSVRQPLDTLLSSHSQRFGLSKNLDISTYNLNNLSSTVTASYHKTNRNTAEIYKKDYYFDNKYSIYFDGDEDFYQTTKAAATLGLQDTSITSFAWVKVASGDTGTIVMIGDQQDIKFFVLSGGALDLAFRQPSAGATAGISTTETIDDGNWHHVGFIARYNGDGGLEEGAIYLDGAQVKSTWGAGVNVSSSIAPSAVISLGAEDASGTRDFTGYITDLAVWNTELTGTEIPTLYAAGSGAPGPSDLYTHSAVANLVSWYRMGDKLPPEQYAPENEPVLLRDNTSNEAHAHRATAGNSELVTEAMTGVTYALPPQLEAIKQTMSAELDGADQCFGGDDDGDPVTAGELQILNDFSVSMWINAETPAAATGFLFQIAEATDGATDYFLIAIRESSGKVVSDSASPDVPAVESSASVVDGAWHHIVVTFEDSANQLTLYVDGVEESQTSEPINLASAYELRIGAGKLNDANDWYHYKGYLDEVTVWNKELTAAEIQKLYRYDGNTDFSPGATNPFNLECAKDGNLSAWWRFGDLSDDTTSMIQDGCTGSLLLQAVGTPTLTSAGALTASKSTVAPPGLPLYDNWFVQHAIPQSDSQYMWITSSMLSSKALGYATASDDITFVSASDIVSVWAEGDTGRAFGLTVPIIESLSVSTVTVIRTDFVGMNHHIYQPITGNFFGYASYDCLEDCNTYAKADLMTGQNTDFLKYNASPAGTYPSYVSVLNSMLLNRNGPYQYPSWKQIRGAEHPVIREQKKTNIMSYLPKGAETVKDFGSNYLNLNDPTRRYNPPHNMRQAPIPLLNYKGPKSPGAPGNDRGDLRPQAAQIADAYNSRQGQVWHLTESVVTSKYHPLIHEFGEIDQPEYLAIADTYGNNMGTFTAENITTAARAGTTIINDLGINVATARPDQFHTKVSLATAEFADLRDPNAGGRDALLEAMGALPSEQQLNYVTYRETVFPREQNTYLKKVRQRENFIIDFWRPSRDARTELNVLNSQGNTIAKQSMWPLDGRINPTVNAASAMPSSNNAEGEMQNRYSLFHDSTPDDLLSAVNYNRAGGFRYSYSVPWETAVQAGKDPFYYNSYDEYAEDMKRVGKDYTVIPEFKISDYMDFYITEKEGSFTWQGTPFGPPSGFLNLTGAMLNNASPPDAMASSSMEGFYNVYSTTDFLRHFEVLDESMTEFASPNELTLNCSAMMKFLPYKGFYPAQRTVELARLFSASFGDAVVLEGGDANFRTFLQPFFMPGILYNTIKAGIAVDTPVYEDEVIPTRLAGGPAGVAGPTGTETGSINSSASFRAPFESLLMPESYLGANKLIADWEQCSGSIAINSTASWDGTGDNRYRLAMHNFLAESIDFFLKDGQLTSFVSKPDGNGFSFPTNRGYERWIMDIKLHDGDLGGSTRTGTTMYNVNTSPTTSQQPNYGAFGPPVYADKNAMAFAFPFAPAYYTYPCLLRINFQPPNDAGDDQTYTLQQILEHSTITPYHDVGLNYNNYNDNLLGPMIGDWMQIDASVNVPTSGLGANTGLVNVKDVNFDAVTNKPISVQDAGAGQGQVLVIQTKFETPYFDFGKDEQTALGRQPLAPYGVPEEYAMRGIWHQYGNVVTGSRGLALEIADSQATPYNDYKNIISNPKYAATLAAAGTVPDGQLTGSLAEVIGMPRRSSKLGQPRTSKIIKEAVVAIPFRINDDFPGGRQYYTLDPENVVEAKRLIGESELRNNVPKKMQPIYDQLLKMKNYVFPPQYDFLTDERNLWVPPIAMYIFEFEHTLGQKDITDIWQNLPPDEIATAPFKTASATISHSLLAGTFLASDDDEVPDINNIKWIVFKVKQKAHWNYFKKTLDTADDSKFQFNFDIGGADAGQLSEPAYSYNWPYDFFSLVELVKIDATTTFKNKFLVDDGGNGGEQ